MTTRWIPDHQGAVDGGQIGGDVQLTNAWTVRFRLGDGDVPAAPRKGCGKELHSLLEISFYGVTRLEGVYDDGIAKDSDGEPIIWLIMQAEYMVCTDPDDPGSTERWCEYDYQDLDRFFGTVDAAETAARRLADSYTAELAERDIAWDGLAPWETGSTWRR